MAGRFVINATMKMVMDDKRLTIVSADELQDRESTELPPMKDSSEANIGINNLLNAIQQGILDLVHQARLEELEAIKRHGNQDCQRSTAKPKISEVHAVLPT